ncbi:MAG: carboxymuconolactone decarboxylase family protein [Candidatus Dormibacterales bacterium]
MATNVAEARIKHPVYVFPEALKALRDLSNASRGALPPEVSILVTLRASQINGCSVCVEMHSRELKQAGASDDRIYSVAAWREAPHFSPAERAALALTEAATRLSDRSNPVPDEVWAEAAAHFDERQLAALTLAIASINAWNRLNVTTAQPSGRSWGAE